MPIIRVLIQRDDQKLDPKAALFDISSEMGIDPERLNLFVEAYPFGTCYRGSGNDSPIINISARTHNGQEWIQRLMTASARAVAKQLDVGEERIVVYAHLIEDGYFLANGLLS
jgi:hypothetical protein